MANTKVKMVIYVKKEKGWTRHKPAIGENRRIRPGHAVVNGKPVKFETFTYQLRTYEGRKAVYQTIGPDPNKAKAEEVRQQRRRALQHDAPAVGLVVAPETNRKRIAKAAEDYLKVAAETTAKGYSVSYQRFQAALPDLVFVDQITRAAMVQFHTYLRKRGNNERTISNRHKHVKYLMMWCGVANGNPKELERLIGKPPRYDKKLGVVYRRDELSSLFASCNERRTIYTAMRILQMTGMRQAEAAHLMWTDIDPIRKEIIVCAKPHLGFRLKDREERRVPIPPELIPILEARRKAVPTHRFVVGTREDTPDKKWLIKLKAIAKRAGLNCGNCRMCRESEGEQCAHWTLHAFRRTYATVLDESNFSLKQIMDLLGHANITTTMRYLGNRRERGMEGVSFGA